MIKKSLALVLALVMVFSMASSALAGSFSHAAVGNIAEITAGDTVNVEVTLDEAISNILVLEYNLYYDSELFEQPVVTKGEVADSLTSSFQQDSNGAFVKLFSYTDAFDGMTLKAGTLATLSFTAKKDIANAAEAEFALVKECLTDCITYDDINDGLVATEPFSITVNPEAPAFENLTYFVYDEETGDEAEESLSFVRSGSFTYAPSEDWIRIVPQFAVTVPYDVEYFNLYMSENGTWWPTYCDPITTGMVNTPESVDGDKLENIAIDCEEGEGVEIFLLQDAAWEPLFALKFEFAECTHAEFETAYACHEGVYNHDVINTCSICSVEFSRTTVACEDLLNAEGAEGKDGLCDLCGGAMPAEEEPAGPTKIFPYTGEGGSSWGSTPSITELSVSGAKVKSFAWNENGSSCTIILAADTPADATITFESQLKQSHSSQQATLYINGKKLSMGSKTNTIQLVDGEAEANVAVASGRSYDSQRSEVRSIIFITEGTEIVPVQQIILTPEHPVVKASGGKLAMHAEVLPENATNKSVTWSVSGGVTISTEGVLYNQDTMGYGSAFTVTATANDGSGVTASVQGVTGPSNETSITLDQNTLSMTAGDEATLKATVVNKDSFCGTKASDISWTSSDEAVASVSGGVVTALNAGAATITATSYYGLTATCEVTVAAGAACDHTDTTTEYIPVEGEEKHTVTVICSCGEKVGDVTTEDCKDEDKNGKCDLCGGEVEGESVIPDGATFTAITTDKGGIVSISDKGTLDASVWGTAYSGPWYHVVLPEGAEYADVTLNVPASGLIENLGTQTPSIAGYYANVMDSEDAGGASFDLISSDANSSVIRIPVEISTWDGSFSLVKADEETPYYAAGPEDASFAPIAFFSFEYAADAPVEPDAPDPMTHIAFWDAADQPITEIIITEGESDVDVAAGCTPRAADYLVNFSSSNPDVLAVDEGYAQAATNDYGHVHTRISGVGKGTAKLTAASADDASVKAELTVIVECGHLRGTVEAKNYEPNNDGTHNVVTTQKCADADCGEPVGGENKELDVECTDEGADGVCDLCGGEVQAPVVSGPTAIYDSSVQGKWGTIYISKLFVEGVTVKNYEWNGSSCVVTLAANTPADAAITFSYEGLGGGGGRGAVYVNGNKNTRTINLVDGEAEVEVSTAASVSISSQATHKKIIFKLDGVATVPVEQIIITPENPVVKASGGKVQLHATVLPENATNNTVTWSVSGGVTISEEGVLYNQDTMGYGSTFTVTATANDGSGVTASVQGKTGPSAEKSIVLDQATLTMTEGEEATLRATVENNDSFCGTKASDITWTSSDPEVATVEGGKVTALKAGTATITATSYYGLTATCEVTVEVEEIILTPETDASGESGAVGNIENDQATLVKDGAPVRLAANASVTWSVEPASGVVELVEATSIEASAINVVPVGEGTAVITATPAKGEPVSYTVTVVDEIISGLTAAISGTQEVNAGKNASVDLYIKSDIEEVYNAFEISVEYDASLLTYTGSSFGEDEKHVVKENGEGKLLVYGYGDAIDASADKPLVTLNFTAKAKGAASVSLTADGAFANNSEIAIKENLKKIDISKNNSATVSIVEVYTVKFSGGTVNEGKTELTYDSVTNKVEFTVDAKTGYDQYKVMVGETELKKDAETGKYILTDLTANTTVTIEYIANTYAVKFEGAGAVDASGEATATFGQPYSFTMHEQGGYRYTYKAEVNGAEVELNGTTIAAKDVTGDIVITITKEKVGVSNTYAVQVWKNGQRSTADDTTVSQNAASYAFSYDTAAWKLLKVEVNGTKVDVTDNNGAVTVPGPISGNINIYYGGIYTVVVPEGAEGEDKAVYGTDYTFTVLPGNELDKVTIDGVEYKPEKNDEGKYVIPADKITGAIEITVKAASYEVEVYEYVKTDGKAAMLIIAKADKVEGKVLTYDGNDMFWSDVYQGYAYLVFTETTVAKEDASKLVAMADGNVVDVQYNCDVNKTGDVDLNDAQLAYDIYLVKYEQFNSDITMEKFLRADVTMDYKVDTADAIAIVSYIDGVMPISK